ncbi:MAG: HAD-IB family phosphatase [Anaerolineales bacterium]|nr:HAD-IB family phosphatase [Anaerolineales bacterium]
MSIIVSDIEGTLTTGSSWKALQRYYLTYLNPWAYRFFILRWLPRYPLVQAGILDREKAMTEWMRREINLFKGFSPDEFRKIAQWIVENEMWSQRRDYMVKELEKHKISGTKIVLVSSAYQPLVELFAGHIDADAIGSSLIYQENKLTGFETPMNAYQQKADNILARYKNEIIAAAYGDTMSDLPMMEISEEPVAVTPSPELRKIAEHRGWRIIDGPE